MYLVVGLGNPGPEYRDHRHNIGFMVADELAERWHLGPLKSKFGGVLGLGEAHGKKLVLLKPMEFMNVSGQAVQRAAAFYQVQPHEVIVIHDEIDLDFGVLRVKAGGGHGGHNGLRSIAEQIGPAFLRVRVGVGHPGHKERVVGHVLGPFSRIEREELPFVVGEAADAVDTLLAEGATTAMNRYNAAKKEAGKN